MQNLTPTLGFCTVWVNRVTNSRLGDELDGKGQKNIKILICYSEYKGQKVQTVQASGKCLTKILSVSEINILGDTDLFDKTVIAPFPKK